MPGFAPPESPHASASTASFLAGIVEPDLLAAGKPASHPRASEGRVMHVPGAATAGGPEGVRPRMKTQAIDGTAFAQCPQGRASSLYGLLCCFGVAFGRSGQLPVACGAERGGGPVRAEPRGADARQSATRRP